MIFDRTQADIDEARELRTKLGRGEALTEDETAKLEKGTLTLTALNRIESKQRDIVQKLNANGYTVSLDTKTWAHGDYFYKSDFERWLSNISRLKSYAPSVTVDPPEIAEALTFEGINKVERILYDTGSAADRLGSEIDIGLALGLAQVGIYGGK